MSGLIGKAGNYLPVCFLLIILILLLYGLYWIITKKQKTFWTVTFVIAGFALFIFAANKYILPRINKFAMNKKSPQIYIYDTDPRNDEFIKGSLHQNKMKRLDFVLMKEKDACGLRLNNQQLTEYSRYDNDVIAGYNRWRKCKDMRRSYHHVIYPDERVLYLKSKL